MSEISRERADERRRQKRHGIWRVMGSDAAGELVPPEERDRLARDAIANAARGRAVRHRAGHDDAYWVVDQKRGVVVCVDYGRLLVSFLVPGESAEIPPYWRCRMSPGAQELVPARLWEDLGHDVLDRAQKEGDRHGKDKIRLPVEIGGHALLATLDYAHQEVYTATPGELMVEGGDDT
jgi:hypothetical protein